MPELPAMRVDHTGMAVESVGESEPFLLALGAEKIHEEASKYGDFTWASYTLGDASRLELIAPEAGSDSFLTAFLDDHGPGLHHITIEVADIDQAIEALTDSGVSVVDRADFEGWSEAFIPPTNPTGALFQLMEYHDGYAEERTAGCRLFIGGERLCTTHS
jgi:methylmalonyl-CoA/ethylmalonyl-CoA epimerase